jgi:hypothetical protein
MHQSLVVYTTNSGGPYPAPLHSSYVSGMLFETLDPPDLSSEVTQDHALDPTEA